LNGTVFADGCLTGIWWEAGAGLTIMLTAAIFLPRYLQSGVITTSSFLGERYDRTLRSWVAMIFVVYYSLVLCPTVLYAGGIAMKEIFRWGDEVPLWWITTLIGLLGAIYAISGGLKSVAVSDCFNGIGLLVVGLAVPILAIMKLPDGIGTIFGRAENLQVWTRSCPLWDGDTGMRKTGVPSLPYDVIPFGITLNNMYYWATNQLIVQRALGAESLAQGQKGVVFAACMKVMGFAFLCIPGIVGIIFQEMGIPDETGAPFTMAPGEKVDTIYPKLVNAVMPGWSKGLFLGVLLGSVLSTFNSALNSASTMFALEIYKVYIVPRATPEGTVRAANVFGIFLTIGSWIVAPLFANTAGLYNQLQLFNTIVSLPILSVFFVGVFSALPDAVAGKSGFVVGAACILAMQTLNPGATFYDPDNVPPYATMHYLHIFEASFLVALEVIIIMTYWPSARSFLGASPRPVAFVARKGGEHVDTTFWKYLPFVICGITFALAWLLVTLQTASQTGFVLFWIIWLALSFALVCAPVPDAPKGEGEESEAGIMAAVLSLRTNTFDRGSIIRSSQ